MSEQANSVDFDRLIDRRGTDSLKWKHVENTGSLPMWVADMDFASPPAVLRALHERIDHGVFGYAVPAPAAVEALQGWLADRYHWRIDPAWIVWLPGLVSGLNVVCRAFADEDDEVLTVAPIYPPFLSAPVNFERRPVTADLRKTETAWEIDFEALQRAVTPRTKILLWCSPHNPTGRAWTRGELQGVVDFCERNDLLLCSDEIHCDLIHEPGLTHTPTALLNEAALARTVTLMSPAKTFNLPGLNCGFALIADHDKRRRFRKAMNGIVPHVNALGYAAAEAAWRHGRPWLDQLLPYLRANHDLVNDTINTLPGLSMRPAQATYLAWIDCRELNLEDPIAFFRRAGVALSDGADFAAPGHVRLNFGCPRSTLQEALARMQKAVAAL